jgi:hypothetical protein
MNSFCDLPLKKMLVVLAAAGANHVHEGGRIEMASCIGIPPDLAVTV